MIEIWSMTSVPILNLAVALGVGLLIGAERERIAQELAEAQVTAARLRALLGNGTLEAALSAFRPPAGPRPKGRGAA